MKAPETTKRNSKSKDSVDFFETQDSTIDILYDNFLRECLQKNNKIGIENLILDFCCGKGAILKRLREKQYVHDTVGYDLNPQIMITINEKHYYYPKQDMFKLHEPAGTYGEHGDALFRHHDVHIVMNPPFNKLTETMDYYLQLKKKYPNIKSLSLLHSARSLEGIARHKIMEEHGYPSLILNMTKRQSFNTYFTNEQRKVWTPTFSCVWSIWDDNYNGKTEFRYIKG